MELQYLYGNPRPLTAKKTAIKTSVAKKMKRKSSKHLKNPIIISENPLSKKEVAKIRKEFDAKGKSEKKAVKAVKKSTKKATKKVAKKLIKKPVYLTAKDIEKVISKQLSKHQGDGTMAKKKAKKVAKKSAKKKTSKIAKSIAKKRVAKKAKSHKRVAKKKTAKKSHRKAHKKVAHAVKKTIKKAKRSHKRSKKAKKVIRAVGGTIVKSGKKYKRHSGKGKTVKAKHTKVSNNARKLKRGETFTEIVQYAPKRRKTKSGKIKLGKSKLISVKAIALNPHKKKKKNPLVMSNPRFMKNPMGSVGSSIVNMENKILNSSGFKSVDSMAKKFLNAGVLEVAGLAVGSAFDGKIVEGFDWVSAKVPFLGEQIAKIPAKYKSAVLVGGFGLGLHALNTFLAKKSGKKSQIIDELSKGLIASTLVKVIAGISPYSVEAAPAMAGYQYTPSALSGRGMGAFVMSNPSASLPSTNADFSGMGGADFEGADYGTSSIGGADFEGLVQSMGSEVENTIDADEAFCDEDYGSDVASVSGIDF